MRAIVLCFIIFSLTTISDAHPLKMAYTSVRYNSDRKIFEVSHRVFQDDFEKTLKENYGYSNDVYINQSSAESQMAVNKFFDKNFKLIFNEKKQKLKYIRTEQKNQMGIILWYETEKIEISEIKTIMIYNYIMMESFKEQFNMFNLNINDKIKETLSFEIERTKGTINLSH